MVSRGVGLDGPPATKPLDQLLTLVYALLGLAILIALLGIANTLALSIVEGTRELGLLRAVGMTRSQLRSSIRWESVIIAVQGTVLGLLIGVFVGWALVSALSDEGITVFRIPYATLAAVVVLAAVAGMAAAVPPSRRAAKLDVLRAVVSEQKHARPVSRRHDPTAGSPPTRLTHRPVFDELAEEWGGCYPAIVRLCRAIRNEMLPQASRPFRSTTPRSERASLRRCGK